MKAEKKQDVKAALKKVGVAVWSALPWVCMTVGLTCWLMLPFLYADEHAEEKARIAALEAENRMYESVNGQLEDEIGWLRSLIEQEVSDGQTQP
jgi:hypothetical protein